MTSRSRWTSCEASWGLRLPVPSPPWWCSCTTVPRTHARPRRWQRREGIAAKHEYEVAVNPFDGQKLSGDGHAPLVYAEDPRADIPAALEEHLRQAIDGADDRIVGGWMQVN